MGRHLDHRHRGSEASERLSKLETDRPGPEDDEGRRQRLRFDRVPVRPVVDVPDPFDGGYGRFRARREDDAEACLVAFPVHLDISGSHDPCVTADDQAALLLVTLDRDLVVPVRGDLPDPPSNRRPFGGYLGLTGKPGYAGRLGQGVSRAHHHFGGDAAPVGALAPDELPLDREHPQAGLGCSPGHFLATHSHADHDQVVLCHVTSFTAVENEPNARPD